MKFDGVHSHTVLVGRVYVANKTCLESVSLLGPRTKCHRYDMSQATDIYFSFSGGWEVQDQGECRSYV